MGHLTSMEYIKFALWCVKLAIDHDKANVSELSMDTVGVVEAWIANPSMFNCEALEDSVDACRKMQRKRRCDIAEVERAVLWLADAAMYESWGSARTNAPIWAIELAAIVLGMKDEELFKRYVTEQFLEGEAI